jgi:16S rRNA (adenine1518-N6/adenine1519-N6)-dimethyltransferase
VPVRDERRFAEVVRLAFAQRRKTLRNALRGLLDADRIEAAGVDPGARAETLDLAAFAALSDVGADAAVLGPGVAFRSKAG